MPQFHETLYGKRYLESQLPKLIQSLELIGAGLKQNNDNRLNEYLKQIAFELKRANDIAERKIINDVADQMQQYEHKISQVLDMYR